MVNYGWNLSHFYGFYSLFSVLWKTFPIKMTFQMNDFDGFSKKKFNNPKSFRKQS